jgi:hypothetical protein
VRYDVAEYVGALLNGEMLPTAELVDLLGAVETFYLEGADAARAKYGRKSAPALSIVDKIKAARSS